MNYKWSKWERRTVILLIVLAAIFYAIVAAIFMGWAW